MTAEPVGLTPRQRDIVAFILASTEQRGFPPTIREIAAHFGFSSPNAALCHLASLERKGIITRRRGSSRGIAVTAAFASPPSGREIPVVGRIAAGTPLLAVENISGSVVVDDALARGGDLFALEVRGESMTGDAIVPGDLVVIRRQQEVSQGEIAAVMIDGEATLKRIHPSNAGVTLRSSNPAVPDILVGQGKAFSILGRAVAVVRKL